MRYPVTRVTRQWPSGEEGGGGGGGSSSSIFPPDDIDMPFVERTHALREYLHNPFMSQLYYRSASLSIMAEIGRMHSEDKLDAVKLIWQM